MWPNLWGALGSSPLRSLGAVGGTSPGVLRTGLGEIAGEGWVSALDVRILDAQLPRIHVF